MPFDTKKVRSEYGKMIDRMYANREIGWAHYVKLCKRPKCWEYRVCGSWYLM